MRALLALSLVLAGCDSAALIAPTNGIDAVPQANNDSWQATPANDVEAIPYSGAESDGVEPLADAALPDPNGYGAFRVLCSAAHLGRFDPIVYPGEAKAGHLHQFYGNTGVTGRSNYASLRGENAPSTCGGVLNQSAYWMPAMLDGEGNAVRPDWISLYYKRWPADSKHCAAPQAPGGCAGIPTALRLIAGFDMLAMKANDKANWLCVRGDDPASARSATITPLAAICNQPGDILLAEVIFPDCWDGVNLDSADHRSHTAYGAWMPEGDYRCPATHPVSIPQMTQKTAYRIVGDLAKWRLSSDAHDGHQMAAGSTLHADYYEAWDEATRLRWERNCLDGGLSCVWSQLGDGWRLKDAPGFSAKANPHRVPMGEVQ